MLFHRLKRHIESSTLKFVSLLFFADIGFIVLHLLFALTNFGYNPLFSIVNDGGYAELFQYLKWFWIIILFVYMSITRSAFGYLAWALLFIYLLGDDAFQIHELAGQAVARRLTFAPPFGIIPQDFGEMIVSATAGIVALLLIFLFYLKGSKAFRHISQDMVALIFLLGISGVIVDVVHTPFMNVWILNLIFVLLEDGGEMFIASLILGYVFYRSSRNDDDDATYLSDFARRSADRYRNRQKEA